MLSRVKNIAMTYLLKTNKRIGQFVDKKIGNSSTYQFASSCQIPNLSSIYDFFFPEGRGVIVEVGAFDGITFSNSSGLISKGWTALLIEPVPESYEKCKLKYSKNSNVELLNLAVGANQGSLEINLAGALSSGDPKTIFEYKKTAWAKKHLTTNSIKVDLVTLDSILAKFPKYKSIDVLIIDVEGFEEEVMKGFNLENVKPKMILIELLDFHPDLSSARESHSRISDRILGAGYTIVYKDSINTIFFNR